MPFCLPNGNLDSLCEEFDPKQKHNDECNRELVRNIFDRNLSKTVFWLHTWHLPKSNSNPTSAVHSLSSKMYHSTYNRETQTQINLRTLYVIIRIFFELLESENHCWIVLIETWYSSKYNMLCHQHSFNFSQLIRNLNKKCKRLLNFLLIVSSRILYSAEPPQ